MNLNINNKGLCNGCQHLTKISSVCDLGFKLNKPIEVRPLNNNRKYHTWNRPAECKRKYIVNLTNK